MTGTAPDLTLIVPCYNEEVNIQKGVVDKIGNYTKEKSHIREVIIVDDGSTDSSAKIIKMRYLKKYPKLRLIENKHQGKAIAVITGIRNAKTEYVIFTDMDLATPLEEIKKMVAEFNKGNEIVIGSRSGMRKGAPLTRKLQSKGFKMIRNLLIGLSGIDDTQCGFKGFRTDAANKIIDKMVIFTENRKVRGASVSAAFDLEFLFIARKHGYAIHELSVEWHHAETKRVSLWKDSIETITDLLQMRLYEFQGKYS